jgi:hypothetical protein
MRVLGYAGVGSNMELQRPINALVILGSGARGDAMGTLTTRRDKARVVIT